MGTEGTVLCGCCASGSSGHEMERENEQMGGVDPADIEPQRQMAARAMLCSAALL